MKTYKFLLMSIIMLKTSLIANCQSIGSGNNLTFTEMPNFSPRINILNNPSLNHLQNTISLEAWIFPTNLSFGCIVSKIETDFTREYDLFIQTNGRIRFGLFNNLNTFFNTQSTNPVPLNRWTHVAATYSPISGVARIYINGILDASNNIGPIIIASTNTNLIIGGYWLVNNITSRNHFNGNIDEVRIWNSERTINQIQTNMCRTIQPQPNLAAYYQLDEMSGLIATDGSGNNNNGTLQFFPAAQINNRPFSGAPIGNASVFNYSATTNLSLASPNFGQFNLNNISGTHAGIHIYRVDALPSQTGNLTNPISTYFGTFVVNPNNTSYDVFYNYNNTILDETKCEPFHQLRNRNDNTVANWNNLNTIINTSTNFLAFNSFSDRTEIIIDTICGIVLPINLLTFEVSKNIDNTTQLYWSISDQRNCAYFIIEKSTNGIDFQPIGKVETKKTGTQSSYSFVDKDLIMGTTYYRIKIIELDSTQSYSEIKFVTNNFEDHLTFFPNPCQDILYLKSQKDLIYSIQDIHGVTIMSNYITANQHLQLNLSHLAKGLYFITTIAGETRKIQKLILQ